MAGSACTRGLSQADQRRRPDDDETEQTKVLSALLGCLMVAEQGDCAGSLAVELLQGATGM